jgi:TerB N-terminal domain
MTDVNPLVEGRWLLPGDVVTIAGRTINCGFAYVGSCGNEPSLIDPELSVSPVGEDLRDRWNTGDSYATFSAVQRGAYLDWLARGRTGKVFVQALFLFLMEVERRWLVDRNAGPEELLALSGELRRLAEANVQEEVFVHYATSLADAIRLWTECTPPSQLAVDFSKISNLRTYVGLAEIASDRRPLPWAWALLLGVGHPHGRAIRRLVVHDEFCALFAFRYEREYGDGIVLGGMRPTSYELSLRNPSLSGTLRPFRDETAGVRRSRGQ